MRPKRLRIMGRAGGADGDEGGGEVGRRTEFQSSSDMRRTRPSLVIPALLTRMSIRLWSSATFLDGAVKAGIGDVNGEGRWRCRRPARLVF